MLFDAAPLRRLVDSFQHTLNHDNKEQGRFRTENDMDERILNHLSQLTEEYCTDDTNTSERIEHGSEQGEGQSFARLEKMLARYYTLMESLEFRMERHEQLTKLTQKSVKLTLDSQERGKRASKK